MVSAVMFVACIFKPTVRTLTSPAASSSTVSGVGIICRERFRKVTGATGAWDSSRSLLAYKARRKNTDCLSLLFERRTNNGRFFLDRCVYFAVEGFLKANASNMLTDAFSFNRIDCSQT
uniref:Putative secreted protein n=1 Tax=Amblyomma tuberculatum TaxID=48802 RepID=A0A6M2E6D8_9ACAR